MNEIDIARNGRISDLVAEAAKQEGVKPDTLRRAVAEGRAIITLNKKRKKSISPLAIGTGLKTKVNANIGTSGDKADVSLEIEKTMAAIEAGADAIMDLSTGGDIDAVRKAVMEASSVPVGTVPVYQAAVDAKKKGKSFVELNSDDFFEAVEKHAEDGVDFVTVHCGLTRASVDRLRKQGRIMGIVSRGGALTAEWMNYNKKENPLYEDFPRLVKLAKKYDLVLSLGDGLRPGCLADATDRAQIEELIALGELTKTAVDSGVQVMIEGPGHMPIDQIEANVLMQKKLCNGAPFYVLGPLVTDIAPGYDHITSAIGGAIAAAKGVDFLCYVTPSEHLRLPNAEDVREGVIASRIAAHAGDIAKGVAGAIERDIKLSKARKALDWDEQIRLSIDPEKAARFRKEIPPSEDSEACSMCGSLCAIKTDVRATRA